MASHKTLPSRSPCLSNGKEDSSIIVRSFILYAMRKGLMVISFFFRRSAGKSCDWDEQCKGDGASSLGGCNDQPGVKGLHVARSYCQSLNKMVSYWSRELLVVASNYLMVIVRDILHDPLDELLNTLPQKSWFYNEYELFFMLPLKGAPS